MFFVKNVLNITDNHIFIVDEKISSNENELMSLCMH